MLPQRITSTAYEHHLAHTHGMCDTPFTSFLRFSIRPRYRLKAGRKSQRQFKTIIRCSMALLSSMVLTAWVSHVFLETVE